MHPSTLQSINKEPQPRRNRDLIAWDGEREKMDETGLIKETIIKSSLRRI